MKIFKSPISRRFSKYRQDEDGSTITEMALVLPLFLVVVFGILQWAWIFSNHVMLDFGHKDAIRLIQSGNAARNGISVAQYKNAICRRTGIINCGRIQVKIDRFNDFGSVSPRGRRGLYRNDVYNTGGPGEIMVATAYYPVPVVPMPLLGMSPFIFATGESGANTHWALSTHVFRNEYYR